MFITCGCQATSDASLGIFCSVFNVCPKIFDISSVIMTNSELFFQIRALN